MDVIASVFGEGVLFATAITLLASVLYVAWQSTYVRERAFVRAVVVTGEVSANVPTPSIPSPSRRQDMETDTGASNNVASNVHVLTEMPNREKDVPTSTSEADVDTGNDDEDGENFVSIHNGATSGSHVVENDPSSLETDVAAAAVVPENGNVLEADRKTKMPVAENIKVPKDSPSKRSSLTAGSINLRLQFLNESQSTVNGNLNEPLGEFRSRHFASELAEHKLVRLIFNGQVLQNEGMTLRQYGFFDDCVVHCIIHQPSSQQDVQGPVAQRDQAFDIDFGSGVYILLGLLLAVAWYFQLWYAETFTPSTTMTLVGLTAFFIISLISTYIPEWEGFQ